MVSKAKVSSRRTVDIHQNARTAPASRAELVARVLDDELPVSLVAAAAGVCPRTVRKWIARYQVDGLDGLADRSSRPHRQSRATPVRTVARIAALRLQRQPGIQIARTVGSRPPPSTGSCAGQGSTGSTPSNRLRRSAATSESIPVSCCTWTSRNSRASTSPATASQGTAASARPGLAGTTCTSASTTTPASASPRSILTRPAPPSPSSSALPSPTSATSASTSPG